MSVVVERNTRTKTVPRKSLIDMVNTLNIKKRLEDHKFAKTWNYRNINCGEAIAESLEVEFVQFQQNIFIEESKELVAKLIRLGYDSILQYPDRRRFDSFSYVMYNEVYNVAFNLYKPASKNAIKTADKIVSETNLGTVPDLVVFLSSLKVLL